MAQFEQRSWTSLGWGSVNAHVAIPTSARVGGILLAWKEELFDQASTWKGQHVAAACLLNRRSGAAVVVASAYGPTVHTLRDELWEDIDCYMGSTRRPRFLSAKTSM